MYDLEIKGKKIATNIKNYKDLRPYMDGKEKIEVK